MEIDKRTSNILDQTNSKTVGAPPSTTGLAGDQLPDTIFTAGNFDLVRAFIDIHQAGMMAKEAFSDEVREVG